MAPPINGSSMTVNMGNPTLTKWAKMILEAMRPNTIPVVMANKMKCSSDKMVEYGDITHKYPLTE